MAHGLKVTKIHKAFKFSKDPFMKGYIEKCIHMRKESKNRHAEKCMEINGECRFLVRLWRIRDTDRK